MDRSPNTRHNGRLAARRLTLLVGAVLLLAGGAAVNAQTKDGSTPLHVAAYHDANEGRRTK